MPRKPIPPRPVGRPSLVAERRAQVLEAFIELIAERGLAAVTLDDVAAAAGMQRTVIRHYVGNRADLIHAAADALIEHYTQTIRATVGANPSARTLVDHLFSPSWATASELEDKALDELFHYAARDSQTRKRLRDAYQLLIDELASAIHNEHPDAHATCVQDAAYQIVALAETNGVFQRLGFPPARSQAAHRLAASIADGV